MLPLRIYSMWVGKQLQIYRAKWTRFVHHAKVNELILLPFAADNSIKFIICVNNAYAFSSALH